MTPATDDDALEAAFEAFLAGRSAPPAAEGLVAFADGVRASAARPPRPTAALAELLATGLLTDQSSAAAVPASAPRRRRSRMFLPTALAKLASAGIAAKAATVAGVVVVGVSTAGFTHTLPGAVQTTWNQVVTHDETEDGTTQSGTTGTTTGTTTDGTTGTGTGTGSAAGTSTDGTTDTSGTGTGTGATTGDGAAVPVQQPPAGNGLGSIVSGKVEHGSVDGVRVSDMAHQRNEDRRAGASSGTGTGTTGDDGSTATTGGDDSAEHESGDDSTTSAGSGSGSGSKGKSHPNG